MFPERKQFSPNPHFKSFCLAIVLILVSVVCRVLFPRSDRNTEPGRNDRTVETRSDSETPEMPRFSEIVYARPDLEGICGDFDGLIDDLTENRLSRREALSRLDALYKRYSDFDTMKYVAQLRYYHDVTESYYADEFDWFLEHEPEVSQRFEQLCYASANCDLAKVLDLEFWGGWVIDEYGEADGNGNSVKSGESTSMDSAFYDLIRQENALLAEYRRVTADPTVFWQGQERSYQELSWDGTISLTQWREIRGLYYEKYTPILSDLFLRLVDVRQQMAAYLGLDSYEDYAYYLFGRDYTPAQADALLIQVRSALAPLYEELQVHSRWDRFQYTELNEAENLEALGCAAGTMDGIIAAAFQDMERFELFDIDVSEKKGDISFQCYLYSYDMPFVFVKTEGFSDDILSFGHEFGHFVDDWYNGNATDSYDLSEVFSQGMEYLLLSRVPEDYREELTEYKLLDTLDTFLAQGSFAEFEHEVYARPASEWTPEALDELALKLAKDYGYYRAEEDDYYEKSWIDVEHFFEQPFYVVSYCISNDTAFQIYERECASAGAGLDCWNKMLPREREGFLETVVQQGGLEDPFSPGRMEKIAALLREKLSGS